MGENDIPILRAVCKSMANGEPASRPSTEDDSAEVLEEPEIDGLATLPPLLPTLVLPIDYPMRRPPISNTVHATNDWLPGSAVTPMVKRLQDILGVDVEGSGVLWRTCSWTRSGEFLIDIGLLKDGVIRCVSLAPRILSLLKSLRIPRPAPALLVRRLGSPQLPQSKEGTSCRPLNKRSAHIE